jgi:hypothetical protein
MTADRVAGVSVPNRGQQDSRRNDAILALCDELLQEVGRRQHIFAWLRAPDAAADQWLPVDAYYPARRLVVVCRDNPGDAFERLVPAHDLRLLQVQPKQLPADRAQAKAALARMITELLPPREPVTSEPVDRPRPGRTGPSPLWRLLEPRKTRAGARSPAAERAARAIAQRRVQAEHGEAVPEHEVAYHVAAQLHLPVVLAVIAGVVLAVVVVVLILGM